jgi:hypothetical protein
MVGINNSLARLLNSLGVALLTLSIMLVPTSTALADWPWFLDDPDAIVCKPTDGCNNGDCKLNLGGQCNFATSDETRCQWSVQGCFGCPCGSCRPQGNWLFRF